MSNLTKTLQSTSNSQSTRKVIFDLRLSNQISDQHAEKASFLAITRREVVNVRLRQQLTFLNPDIVPFLATKLGNCGPTTKPIVAEVDLRFEVVQVPSSRWKCCIWFIRCHRRQEKHKPRLTLIIALSEQYNRLSMLASKQK